MKETKKGEGAGGRKRQAVKYTSNKYFTQKKKGKKKGKNKQKKKPQTHTPKHFLMSSAFHGNM